MEALLILLALLWAIWWFNSQLFPGPARVLQRLTRWLTRSFVSVTWSRPVRQFGIGRTIWLWSVALAVLVTVQSLAAPVDVMTYGQRLLAIVPAWLLVAAGWQLLLWWSRRRFQARPLPQRRLRRR